MKYTEIIKGTTFYMKEERPNPHYWIGEKNSRDGRYICWNQGGGTNQTTYSETQILKLLNDGTWIIYEEDYEIY